MGAVRFILRFITGIIYLFYILVALYFPASDLLTYVGRETRMFHFPQLISIKDIFLPSLLVALLYAGISAIRKRIQPRPDLTEKPEVAAGREVAA